MTKRLLYVLSYASSAQAAAWRLFSPSAAPSPMWSSASSGGAGCRRGTLLGVVKSDARPQAVLTAPRVSLIAAAAAIALLVFISLAGPRYESPSAFAQETKTATTAAAGVSAHDAQLARHLDVLEEMEILEHWDLIELLPVLEER